MTVTPAPAGGRRRRPDQAARRAAAAHLPPDQPAGQRRHARRGVLRRAGDHRHRRQFARHLPDHSGHPGGERQLLAGGHRRRPAVTAFTIGTVAEDATTAPGFTVASFAAANVADWNTTYRGIAVTLISGGGRWQYSLNNGVTWLPLTVASDASALLLRATDRVRYLPGNWNGEALLGFRPWTATGKSAGTRPTSACRSPAAASAPCGTAG
ncbi:MAG: hypothetical protein U0736_00555 [Gemmataceae bacterium]